MNKTDIDPSPSRASVLARKDGNHEKNHTARVDGGKRGGTWSRWGRDSSEGLAFTHGGQRRPHSLKRGAGPAGAWGKSIPRVTKTPRCDVWCVQGTGRRSRGLGPSENGKEERNPRLDFGFHTKWTGSHRRALSVVS